MPAVEQNSAVVMVNALIRRADVMELCSVWTNLVFCPVLPKGFS